MDKLIIILTTIIILPIICLGFDNFIIEQIYNKNDNNNTSNNTK